MMVGVSVVWASNAYRWMEDVVVVGCGDGGGKVEVIDAQREVVSSVVGAGVCGWKLGAGWVVDIL